MDQSQPSRLGSLVLQGFVQTIAATVMSAAVVGSLILQGDLIQTSQNNTAPSLVYDSGSYLTFSQAVIAVSGSYVTANIQVPSKFASGAILHAVSIECNGTPQVLSGVIALHATTKMGLYGGSTLRRDIRVGTGGFVQSTTGATINTKIPASQYVSFTGSGGISIKAAAYANENCVFKAWFHAKYGK